LDTGIDEIQDERGEKVANTGRGLLAGDESCSVEQQPH